MFVCFAPKENPKIVVAVVVQNAGYGARWAAPIGSLLVEKYLNDTLRTERVQEADQIASSNLMPKYLVRLQYRSDSLRAASWARQTGDSTRWKKYQLPSFRTALMDTIHRTITQQLLQDMQKAAFNKPSEEVKAQEQESSNN